MMIQLNTIRQSVTQHSPHVECYTCQGAMCRPIRSSSGPPRKQIQELFSFPALWDPKCSHVSVTKAKVYKLVYIELVVRRF